MERTRLIVVLAGPVSSDNTLTYNDPKDLKKSVTDVHPPALTFNTAGGDKMWINLNHVAYYRISTL